MNRDNRIPESFSLEDNLRARMESLTLNANPTRTNPEGQKAYLPPNSQSNASTNSHQSSPYDRVFRMSNSTNTQPRGISENVNDQKPFDTTTTQGNLNRMTKPRPLSSRDTTSVTERYQLAARRTYNHSEVTKEIKKSKLRTRQEVKRNFAQSLLLGSGETKEQERQEAQAKPPTKPKKKVTFNDIVEVVYPPTSYLDF